VDLPPVLWIPGFAALGGTEDGGTARGGFSRLSDLVRRLELDNLTGFELKCQDSNHASQVKV
jgi:hypothetical protein